MSDLTSNTSRRGEASGAFLEGEAEDGRGLISEASSDGHGYGTGTAGANGSDSEGDMEARDNGQGV